MILRIFLFHVQIRNFETYPFLVLVLMLVHFYCLHTRLLYMFDLYVFLHVGLLGGCGDLTSCENIIPLSCDFIAPLKVQF